MPLTQVTRESRDGFEIYILFLCVLAGFPIFLGGNKPNSITDLLPESFQLVWSICLVGGAVVALAGIFWPRRAVGLLLEQGAMSPLAVASIVYGILVLVNNGLDAFIPAAIVGGFGIACVRRWFRIQGVIKVAVAQVKRKDRWRDGQ